jgi:hypothetical protein
MKASEAYKTAVNFNHNKHINELKQIIAHIGEQCANGSFELVWSYGMMDETRDILIGRGYDIQRGGRMNEDDHNISWGIPKS